VPPRLGLRVLPLLLLVALTGCDIPIGAIRRSPPKGIESRAIAAEAQAPDVALHGTAGRFALSDVVAHDNVLLVFYRGHW
jgi:hypothetical protein